MYGQFDFRIVGDGTASSEIEFEKQSQAVSIFQNVDQWHYSCAIQNERRKQFEVILSVSNGWFVWLRGW